MHREVAVARVAELQREIGQVTRALQGAEGHTQPQRMLVLSDRVAGPGAKEAAEVIWRATGSAGQGAQGRIRTRLRRKDRFHRLDCTRGDDCTPPRRAERLAKSIVQQANDDLVRVQRIVRPERLVNPALLQVQPAADRAGVHREQPWPTIGDRFVIT